MAIGIRRIDTSIVLWLMGLLVLAPLLWAGVNVYDEGIILVGADRVARGEWPQRDFWAMYPPGQFLVLASLFKAFGTSILVGRIYDMNVKALLAVAAAQLSDRLRVPQSMSVVVWALSLLWMGYVKLPLYPVYPAVLLIFCGLILLQKHIGDGGNSWLFASGALLAAAGCFRHDLAGLTVLAVAAVLVIRCGRREAPWGTLIPYVAGAGLVGVVVMAIMVSHVDSGMLVDQLLITPAKTMPLYRALPFPFRLSGSSLKFWIVPIVILLGSVVSWRAVKRGSGAEWGYGALASSFTGLAFANQLRVRADTAHLLPMALVAIVLLPKLLSDAVESKAGARARKATYGALVTASLGGLLAVSVASWHGWPPRSRVARAGYAAMPAEMRDTILYVQAITSPAEPVYVGVTNHDHFVINDVALSFLSGRDLPTRYHELHPGVTTRASVQRTMVAELERNAVNVIVLAPNYRDEPNLTRNDLGIDVLDDYITAHFVKVRVFGPYEVWRRAASR